MSPTSAHASKSDLGTGVVLILIVCISVQFGAAFAVHLFPALGPWGHQWPAHRSSSASDGVCGSP
ncbi:hypothetical protein HF984_05375 [Rothia terrae]|uniref:Uncharacterized protein n=1 Tax=Rothia terrae TaxID=396015 RepID=A0A7H2BEG9_9MICC|nr:hypothetical protein [Rothia terrae]MDT0189455.1 hypothetical protein [Rothia terrae]NKZ34201.1 hypothetical protein [Rothia terrae]QNV38065.1 hypothetical protein IDM49_01875 [Rothia terrae]